MAQNVVIDINASTKQFESALDELTAKVKSTAAQMDKAFSVGGEAAKQIKNTDSAAQGLHGTLKSISIVAAGNVLAEGFEKAYRSIKSVGKEIYSTTERMQNLEMSMKSIVSSDAIKTGKYKDYSEAIQHAEKDTEELMAWFKKLSLVSPYEYTEVIEAFKQNANMGQTVEQAKVTTKAILSLGSGLGMTTDAMKRFSMALAQTGATGKISAADLRQFANAGFGMDKFNDIFAMLSEKYGIIIKDHNDFNNAVKEGKLTTDDFFNALGEFAEKNYGGAVEAMASTIGGLKSSLSDIKTNAINDLFLETSKTISKTLKPYIEYLMELLTSGSFTEWGKSINKWATKAIQPLQKIGDMLQNGKMSRAIKNLKDFFNGKAINTSSIKIALKEIGGDKFAETWLARLDVIKDYIDRFMAHKDEIIGALKGIGIAFGTAFAVNKIREVISLIASINPSLVALTALGAAFGIAWKKNLFGIQERIGGFIERAKSYIGSLKSVYDEKGLSGVWEKLRTDGAKAFSELPQKFAEALSGIGSYISEHSDEWLTGIKNTAFDVVGFVFGPDAENGLKQFVEVTVPQKIEEYKNAWDTNGFAGIWEQFSSDANTEFAKIGQYIDTHKGEWLAKFETGTVNLVKMLFGEDASADVEAYIAELHSAFESGGIQAVILKIGEDIGHWIINGLMQIELVANVVAYGTKLQQAFSEGGVQGVAEQIGKDVSGWIWQGINAIGTLTNTTEFTNSLKTAFDEGGILNLGKDIGDWLRDGIESALTNLLGEDDAEAITSGLSFLDDKLFGNVSDAIESFHDTLQRTIDNITDLVDENTWENAKKTFGLVAGIVAEIGIAVSAMLSPAIEGMGDTFTDFVNLIDKVLAFMGKLFDIFQDIYKGDWEKLGEDAVDLGGITERIVESIVQVVENVLMTITDMVVRGIASIIPGGDGFLENTWKPIMGNYRERQQLRREYGFANVNNAEGVLDYLLENHGVGSDFAHDLSWRYDIFDNQDQMDVLIKYLGYLTENGEEANKKQYAYYQEALTAYKEGTYDAFIEPYNKQEAEQNAQDWDVEDFMNTYYGHLEQVDEKLVDYVEKQLESNEITKEQAEIIYDWARKETELMDLYPTFDQSDRALFEGVPEYEATWFDEFLDGFMDFEGSMQEYVDQMQLTAEQFEMVNKYSQEQYEAELKQWESSAHTAPWFDENGEYTGVYGELQQSVEAYGQTVEDFTENAQSIMLQQQEAFPDFDSVNLRDGFDRINTALPEASSSVEAFTDVVEQAVRRIGGLGFKQSTMYKNSLAGSGTATGRRRVSKVDEFLDKVFGGSESLLPASGVKGSVVASELLSGTSAEIEDSFYAIVNSGKEYFVDEAEGLVEEVDRLSHRMDGATSDYRNGISYFQDEADGIVQGVDRLAHRMDAPVEEANDALHKLPKGIEYFVDEAEGLVIECDRLADRMDGTGQRNRYMSYMYKSPEEVDTALDAFKQMDFATLLADYPIEEDDINYLQELLSTSNDSNLTAEQRLADLQAAATSYFENSMHMPEEIRDAFLPILTSKNTNLYQAQDAVSTLAENMEENKSGSGGGEGGGEGTGTKTKTVGDTFDDLIKQYNSASGSTKDVLGYQLQAMLDATYLGEEWSGNMGEGRLLLTDLMNGKFNNETYLAAKQAMTNGQYSQAIYDAMAKSYTDTYTKALTEDAVSDENYQDFVSTVLGSIVEQGEGLEGEDTEGGLFSKMFGDQTSLDADFQKLQDLITSIGDDFDALYKNAQDFGNYLTDTLISQFGSLKDTGVGAFKAIGETARSIIRDLEAVEDAVADAIKAFLLLNGGGSGGSTKPNTNGTKPNPNSKGHGSAELLAGGGTIFPYGTAIVGEHGPEIIRTGSSRLNVFANSQLMDEINRTRHSLNMLSNSAELVAYNRLIGGGSNTTSTDNSQHFENHFGAVIGDKAFRDMVDDEVRKAWRREMRLAN